MSSNKIRVRICDSHLIEDELKTQMWEVYQEYYAYTADQFLARFDQNDHYALFYQGERMIGFTALRIQPLRFQGRWRLLIYFGQAVVNRNFRGNKLNQLVGLKICQKYWYYFLFSKVYFWCDALTYKPYLAFARPTEDCYPTYKTATPTEVQELMDFIGQKNYGEQYLPERGIVQKPVKYVSDPATHIMPKDLAHPDIRYFQEANPQHVEGTGLLTLAPANGRNMWSIVKYVFRGKLKRWRRQFRPAMIPYLS